MDQVGRLGGTGEHRITAGGQRRWWEVGAVVALVSVLIAGEWLFLSLHAQQQSLDRELVGALADRNGERMRSLVRRGASARSVGGLLRNSCTSLAAGMDDPALLREVLDRGGPLDATGGLSVPPLLAAAHARRAENTRLLLQRGARVDAVWIISDGTALTAAVQVPDNSEVIRLLLEANADPNHIDRYGRTVLSCAVEAVEPKAVAMLLEAGADRTLRDRDGRTALDVARAKVGESTREIAGASFSRRVLERAQRIVRLLDAPRGAPPATKGRARELTGTVTGW